jgi:hypothetical protein
LNPRLHEAQLEDRKPRKAQEGHLEEGKTTKHQMAQKMIKQRQNKEQLKIKNSS